MNILSRRLTRLEASQPSEDCVTICSWAGGEINVMSEGDNRVDREPGETELLFVERALRELLKTATRFPRVIWALRNGEQESNPPAGKPYADVFRLVDEPTSEEAYPNKLPLCLIEVALDIGQEKSTGVICNLARLADIPAFVALYTHAEYPNPSNTNWPDIDHFRIKRIWPRPEASWRVLAPDEWARALVQIRGWQLRRFEIQDAVNDSAY